MLYIFAPLGDVLDMTGICITPFLVFALTSVGTPEFEIIPLEILSGAAFLKLEISSSDSLQAVTGAYSALISESLRQSGSSSISAEYIVSDIASALCG